MRFFAALMYLGIIAGIGACGGPTRIQSAAGNTISITFSDMDAAAGHGDQEAANRAQQYCQSRGRNAELIMRSGMNSGITTVDFKCVQ